MPKFQHSPGKNTMGGLLFSFFEMNKSTWQFKQLSVQRYLYRYQLPDAPPPPEDPPPPEKPPPDPLLPELHDPPEPPEVTTNPPIEAFPLVRKSVFAFLYQAFFPKMSFDTG